MPTRAGRGGGGGNRGSWGGGGLLGLWLRELVREVEVEVRVNVVGMEVERRRSGLRHWWMSWRRRMAERMIFRWVVRRRCHWMMVVVVVALVGRRVWHGIG